MKPSSSPSLRIAVIAQWVAIVVPALGLVVVSLLLTRSLEREQALLDRVRSVQSDLFLERSDHMLAALDWMQDELQLVDEIDAIRPRVNEVALAPKAPPRRQSRGRRDKSHSATSSRIEVTCDSSDPLCGLEPR